MADDETNVGPTDDSEDVADLLDSGGDDGGTELGRGEESEGPLAFERYEISYEDIRRAVYWYWKEHSVGEHLVMYHGVDTIDLVTWVRGFREDELKSFNLAFKLEKYMPRGGMVLIGPEGVSVLMARKVE